MLYQAYQAHADLMLPIRALAGGSAQVISLAPLGITDNSVTRNLTAAYELIARSGLSHARPPYGIRSVMVGNREVEVQEKPVLVTPFGTLLHFKKDMDAPQPRVLLVAPLSGHFATLAARDRAHHAAGPRRLHHRLAQCARHPAQARPLRF